MPHLLSHKSPHSTNHEPPPNHPPLTTQVLPYQPYNPTLNLNNAPTTNMTQQPLPTIGPQASWAPIVSNLGKEVAHATATPSDSTVEFNDLGI